MRRTNIYSFVLVFAAIFTFSSCFQDLDLEPRYGLNAASVYEDPDNYINVLAKLYAGLSLTGNDGPAGSPDITGIDEGSSSYIRVLWNLQEVPTDETVVGWNDPGLPELNTMEWVGTNVWTSAMYYRIFFQVTLCNEFIRETDLEKLEDRGFDQNEITTLSRYHHEARFLRALSYFHALDLFGDNVPFVTTEDKIGAFLPEATSTQNMFDYIETELLEIESELLDPVVGFDPNVYGRANKAAVWTLLAKLYLNAESLLGQDRYADCMNYCQKVIDAGYSLEPEYPHLFLIDNHTSPEIIFPVTFDGKRSTTYGGTTFLTHAPVGGTMNADSFGINTGWAGYRATPKLVEKFDELISTSDFDDDGSGWTTPGNSSWSYDADREKMLYESADDGYAADGLEMDATYENNRSMKVTFRITKFSRFVDTMNVDSINDGGYVAVGDGSNPSDDFMFTGNGAYTANFNTGTTNSLRFYGQNSTYELDIVNVTYTDGDDRFLFHTEGQEYEIDDIGQFTQGFAVRKWKNVDVEGNPGSDATGDFIDTDYPFFRLADVYLMYAEAAARSGQNVGTGQGYLNDVRERSNANAVTSYDAQFVLDERARELYWEGSRRRDLIRYGQYTSGTYLWPWKGGVQEGQSVEDYLQIYPLPEADLTANPNLIQNEGY